MEVKVWFCMCVLLHWIILALCVHEQILFSNSHRIMELDVDTRNVTVLVEYEYDEIYAMDYDCRNRYIYFPRIILGYIMRFKYPSENRTLERVIQTQRPVGIAVDSINEHVYWINYQKDNTLSRSNLDGTNVVVVPTPLLNTFAIRIDLTSSYNYPGGTTREGRLAYPSRATWVYMVDRHSGISKSRYDLTKHQTIVNFTAQLVDCIDIDTEEHRLYWINYDGVIQSAKDDGSDITPIHSTNVKRHYYAIDFIGSYIYYANNYQLLMVDKTPGSTPTVLYTNNSWIASIFVFNQSVQPTTSQISQRLHSISNNTLVQSITTECRTAEIRSTGLLNYLDS